MTNPIPEISEIASEMADAARRAILPYFRSTDLNTENKDKSGFDPVTIADRAAEEVMREIIAKKRPDDSIWGEEFGKHEGTSGLTWVLDPIDGTRGFISGTPTWGVLIAVSNEDGPIFGMIDQPYTAERFVGHSGQAQLTGPLGTVALKTRPPRALAEATILTTFPEVGSAEEGAAFHAVASQTQLTRYGMDCYGYALLAAGQVDLVIEAGLNAYDIQAPIAVIEGAGGIVTDWTGAPAHNGGRVIAASNPSIHAEALAILKANS